MKTLRAALLVNMVLIGSVLAWTSPMLYNVCNSAPAPGGTVWVNVDAPDIINPTDDISAMLFYSDDNQESWDQVPMTMIGTPGYDSTFGASFSMPGSGQVYYYVRAQNATNFGTQGPKNTADVWPVTDNWLTELAVEGTGDTINNPAGEYLDLTSAAMGYSDTYFYGRLTNQSTSWPTRASILGPWFLYTVGFRNADATALDTFGYAMTYADVAGIYTSGLFELNTYTHDFTRIGDIETQNSGNRMILRCHISDVTARAGFQPWPNTGGFLCSAKGETRSANLSLDSWQHDSTNSSRFYVNRTPKFTTGQNTAPVLSQARVVPTQGLPETSFWFNVRYTDADSNLPVAHSLVVDDETLALRPNQHQYWAGVLFDHTQNGFGIGWHRFHFLFNDGMAEATSSPDSFEILGTAVVEQTPGASGLALDARPNPFSSMVELRGRLRGRLLHVFDHCGKLVRSLTAGGSETAVTWDGRDGSGRALPDGVYFLREDAGPLRRLLVKLSR
jgi:hypothetical protein